VEKQFSIVEPLIDVFRDRRLNVDFDVSTSQHHALKKLLTSPYQLIVSGASLAQMEDFLLPECIHVLDTHAPMVVSANKLEQDCARRVLEHGAFDVITHPLDHEQTVNTIRRALWQGRLMNLNARRERLLSKYQEHVAEYPGDARVKDVLKKTLV